MTGFYIQNVRRAMLLALGAIFLAFTVLNQCGGKTVETDYYKNLKADQANPMNQESFAQAIGQDKYDTLLAGIGQEELNVLQYGAGSSNVISLLLSITDVTKVVALMNGTRKLTAIDVVSLMNRTDWHIRNFRYFGFSGEAIPAGDTIAKMANLLAQVNDMQGLKDLVHSAKDDPGNPNSYMQNRYDRLAYILSNVDEGSSTMPTIINDVMLQGSGPYSINISGRDAMMRMINGVPDLNRVTKIVSDIAFVGNLTEILVWLTNVGHCVVGSRTNQFDCERNPELTPSFWTNCDNGVDTTQAACAGSGANWEIGGTDAMTATMNSVTNVDKMSYLINNLEAAPNVTNDEDFEADTVGTVPFQTQSWATTGDNDNYWQVSNVYVDGGSRSARANPNLSDNEISSLELNLAINVNDDLVTPCSVANACSVSFRYRTRSQAGDRLKFYINDVLRHTAQGNMGSFATFSYNITTPGKYTLRWEYVKDGSGSSADDTVYIDNITISGDHGASRTPAQKVAIMLNKLYLDSIQNVADIMNKISPSFVFIPGVGGYGTNPNNIGFDNLIYTMNKVEYPIDINDMPNMIAVVNDLIGVGANNGIDTMVEILENTVPAYTDPLGGTAQLVNVLNFSDPAKLTALMNGLVSANAASKMYSILNNLTTTGTSNMAEVTGPNGANVQYLVDLIDAVSTTSHIATILANIGLHGRTDLTVNGQNSRPTGAIKMAQIMDQFEVDPELTREYHLVRMIEDIAAIPAGAKNTGIIVGTLDSTDIVNAAISPGADGIADGVNRLREVMSDLYVHPNMGIVNYSATPGPNYDNVYINPLQTETSDMFGRVTTLINVINGSAPQTVAWLVSGVNDPNIMSYMLQNAHAVEYMSYLLNNLTNVQLLLDLLNDPGTNVARVTDILNFQGDLSYGYPGALSAPSPRYTVVTTKDATGTTTGDPLGRMVVLINTLASSQGISNVVSLLNGVTDWQNDLMALVNRANRLVYLTDIVDNLTNVNLMITLMNDPDLDPTKMENMVDTMGDWSYPTATPPTPYTSALQPSYAGFSARTRPPDADALGRMTILINEVNTGAGVNNIIRSINEICDLSDLTGLVAKIQVGSPVGIGAPSAHPSLGVHRVRYLADVMNNVQNIDLMLNIINGPNATCAGSNPGMDYNRLVNIMNDIGDSTEMGTIGKAVGDMDILWGTINELGYDYIAMANRPLSDQTKLITLTNLVDYCGIRPAYDTTIPNYPKPSGTTYFYPCDNDMIGSGWNGTYDNRPRLSAVMLGMNSAQGMAILAAEVDAGNIDRTVGLVEGTRSVNTIVGVTNLVPGEVMAAVINSIEDFAVYRGMGFMMNALSPQALSALMHFGTGIGENTSRTGTCRYFTGLGPRRTALLLNVETGQTLKSWVQDRFGYRTGIASVLCGLTTPNASNPQNLCNWYSGSENCGTYSANFYRHENIVIGNDPHYGTYEHRYQARDDACHRFYDGGVIVMGGGLDAFCSEPPIVNVLWSNTDICLGIVYAGPGLAEVWNILNGRGALGWIYSQTGSDFNDPPGSKDWNNCRLNLNIDGTGKPYHPAVQYRNTDTQGYASDTMYNYNPNGTGTGYGWHGGQPATPSPRWPAASWGDVSWDGPPY